MVSLRDDGYTALDDGGESYSSSSSSSSGSGSSGSSSTSTSTSTSTSSSSTSRGKDDAKRIPLSPEVMKRLKEKMTFWSPVKNVVVVDEPKPRASSNEVAHKDARGHHVHWSLANDTVHVKLADEPKEGTTNDPTFVVLAQDSGAVLRWRIDKRATAPGTTRNPFEYWFVLGDEDKDKDKLVAARWFHIPTSRLPASDIPSNAPSFDGYVERKGEVDKKKVEEGEG